MAQNKPGVALIPLFGTKLLIEPLKCLARIRGKKMWFENKKLELLSSLPLGHGWFSDECLMKFQTIPGPQTMARHPPWHLGRNLLTLQSFQNCLPTCNIRGLESWHINKANIFCKFALAPMRALSICTVCTTRYHFQPEKLHTLKLSHKTPPWNANTLAENLKLDYFPPWCRDADIDSLKWIFPSTSWWNHRSSPTHTP